MKFWRIPHSLRTTLIYILFGSLWILLSDSVLKFFIPHTSPAYPLAQTIKGWFFILVSALLLYTILKRDETALDEHIRAERENQRLYRDLFETNPHPMWVYDLETLHFLMVNDAAIDHYGYNREEFLKMTIKDIRPAEQIPALMANLANPPQVLEKSSGWQHLKKDGTLIDVEISSHSLNFEGRPARMVLANDVTEQKKTEQALKRSEAQFRTLVEQMPAVTYIAAFDDLSSTLYISPQIEQILGFTPEEFLNPQETWANQIHPEDRERVYEEIRYGKEHRESFYSEYRMLTKDGEIVWISDAANLVLDEQGNPLFLEGFMLDVTERRQAEEALRISEENYRSLVETSDNAIAVLNWEGKVLYANPSGMLIWEDPHIVGKMVHELFPKEIADRYLAVIQDVIQYQVVNVNEIKTYIKGREMWFQVSMMPLKNSDGSVNTLLLNAWDLTERKRAENLLKQSEERFRLMAENIEEGFWITDPISNGEIYLSPATERIFGRSIEELMQTQNAFLESILPEDRPQVLEKLEIQKRGKPTSMEYRIQRADGKVRWVWDRAFPIFKEDGTVKYVTGLVSDITERKETEAFIQTQLKRLSALNAIDRAISINTDLTLTLNLFIVETMMQLQVDAVDVLLIDPSKQTLQPISQLGFTNPSWGKGSLKLGEGLAGRIALEQKKIIVYDLSVVEDPFVRVPLHEEEGFVSYFGIPLITKGQVKGVLEVFHRSRLNPPGEWLNFLDTLGGQAAIAIENAQLFEGLQRSNQELMMAYDATIAGWSHAMDLRDKETEGHTQRVTELTLKLAERMGISEQEQVHIKRGALLHDIGKLGVPDHILLKPGKLTDEEWVIMRKHPTYAHDMLVSIPYLRPALDIPYCHHEKWDGSGYPRGLKGEDIPLSARIFAIVDVWDALRSNRHYREGWSTQKALDYILAESGKHFDPNVVAAFMQFLKENPNMLP